MKLCVQLGAHGVLSPWQKAGRERALYRDLSLALAVLRLRSAQIRSDFFTPGDFANHTAEATSRL
jgi:hypothetical protein